ncbi:MAG: stage II sporulation protein M [Verrucomicrobiaceae bacterium]
MNRQEFEQRKSAEWNSFELHLSTVEKSGPSIEPEKVPGMFRRVCHDLALAQYRMYGARVCDRLNNLAIRGYRLIHRNRGGFGERSVQFTIDTFPNAFRREWKLFVLASLVFWLPFFLMWWSASKEIAWVQSILGAEGMANIEGMYGKDADTVSFLRQEHGSNFMMFAFYIWNNVGIDFRLFASGILYGVGTLFFLVFNGLNIGAVVGYVEYAGDPEKLWSFVAGHSSFELLGMIVVGMAGLKMGFALLDPGRLTRGEALSKAGRDGLPLLIGGACMTGLAAVVEGFWSAQPVENATKYAVGIFFWVLHVLYFSFVGRGRSGA